MTVKHLCQSLFFNKVAGFKKKMSKFFFKFYLIQVDICLNKFQWMDFQVMSIKK